MYILNKFLFKLLSFNRYVLKENKMDSITKFTEDINQLLLSNKTVIEDNISDSINVRTIETRETLIFNLTNILKTLSETTSTIKNKLEKAKATQNKDRLTMDLIFNKLHSYASAVPDTVNCKLGCNDLENINSIQNTNNNTNSAQNTNHKSQPLDDKWTTITRKKAPILSRLGTTCRSYASATTSDSLQTSTNSTQNTNSAQNTNTLTTLNTSEPYRTRIKFTESLFLNAIQVPSFDNVKQDGELYYVESKNHFAFRIAGHLLHGNIGVIYTDEKSPENIKDCKFAESCMKRDNCDYYHDPLKFSDSNDVRNYTASSFLYAPPNSQYKNRPHSRRFGSRDHLDTDIVALQDEDINRFNDQTMHDLLCSLLISSSVAYAAQSG